MRYQKRIGSLLCLLHSEILNSSDLIELTSKEVNQTKVARDVINVPAKGAALEELPAGRAAQLRAANCGSGESQGQRVSGIQLFWHVQPLNPL